MEYERLTDEKFIKALKTCDMACVYGENCIECVYFKHYDCDELIQGKLKKAIQYLAELEDKIEKGTLIELPCKVGDTVYVVYPVSGIQELEVGGIGIHTNDIAFRLGHKGTEDYNVAWLKEEGEYLFFTREEAEKRLKELQNG